MHIEKSKLNKSKAGANSFAQNINRSNNKDQCRFVNSHPESIARKKPIEIVNNSTQDKINNSTRMEAQFKQIQTLQGLNSSNKTIKRNPLETTSTISHTVSGITKIIDSGLNALGKNVIQKVKYKTVRSSSKSHEITTWGGINYRPYEVQTDEGNWIEIFIGESRYHEEMEENQLKLTTMEKDNDLYNCHGFAFGGAAAEGGPFSFLDAGPINQILADEYTSAPPRVGGTVVFGDAAHSGIIVSIETGKGTIKDRIMVRSKLGSKPLSTESVAALEKRFGAAKYYITNIERDRKKLESEIEEIGIIIMEQLALRREMLQQAQRLLASINKLAKRSVPSMLDNILSTFGLSNELVVHQENASRLHSLSQELQMVMQEIRELTVTIKNLSVSFSERIDQL